MFGNFRQSFTNAMQGADSAIAAQAAQRQALNMQAGVGRNREAFMNGTPEELAQRIGSEKGMSDPQREALRRRLEITTDRTKLADRYSPGMNRGPFEMGQQGIMEMINQGIAQNPVVRRGVLPTAVAGGGIMGGALVTEGAQQLMALMGFMQQGAEQQERAEQSPLT